MRKEGSKILKKCFNGQKVQQLELNGVQKKEIISKCRHKINNVYGTSAEQENNDVYID